MSMDLGSIPVGVVGLGLMGKSIATCLLAAGHPVAVYDSDCTRREQAPALVASFLNVLETEGLPGNRPKPAKLLENLGVADNIAGLSGARIVFEVIIEDAAAKRALFEELESVLLADTIIASNTSAIPITVLQQGMLHPGRFIGVHWAEPAHLTRFLEIIAGAHTDKKIGPFLYDLAAGWGKEPALVRRDIRGFVANRIMFAMIREAFYLVESGVASIEDVDRSVRNDVGSWATLAGPFRWMDLTGILSYAAVMRDLLPELSNAAKLPELMEQVVASGALGTANAKGFYQYTAHSAREWDETFQRFSLDIRRLQHDYPEPFVDPAAPGPGSRSGDN